MKGASATRRAVIQTAGGTSSVTPTRAVGENLAGDGESVPHTPQIPTSLRGPRRTRPIERRRARRLTARAELSPTTTRWKFSLSRRNFSAGAEKISFSTIAGLVLIASSCSGRARTCARSGAPPSGAQMGRSKCVRTCGRRSTRYTQPLPDTAFLVYTRSCLGKARARMRPCGDRCATLWATTPTGRAS